MTNLDDQLAETFERLADRAPHHPDLARATRRRVRRRRTVITAAVLAAGSVVAVTGLASGLLGGAQDRSVPAVTVVPSCESNLTRAVLPEWARTGFSDAEPVMPFARSAHGDVVAILFVDELAAPPRADVANKVLWVWRRLPADPATIHATARLNGTGPIVTAGLPTPAGPSYVNLPAPGCWRLTLTWPGGRDTIDLRVLAPEDIRP
jgi:hypothetical protein